MWDSLWYPKIFLVHSIGLRANLIAIGNGKSLYRPSGTVFAETRLKKIEFVLVQHAHAHGFAAKLRNFQHLFLFQTFEAGLFLIFHQSEARLCS